MKRFLFIFIFLILISSHAFAQLEKPVKWSYFAKKVNNTEAIIYIKAKMDANWHIYAQSIKSESMKLKFSFKTSKEYSLIGKVKEPKPIKKYDDGLNMELAFFEKEVVFTQKIKLIKPTVVVKTAIEFMVCNDKQCLPPDEITFNISFK